MIANLRTAVFAPSLCLSTSSCPSNKNILLFLEQRPAHLRLALVQPGQRLYLGLNGVVHPGQMPYLPLDVVLHPGQMPYLALDVVLRPGQRPFLALDVVLHPHQRPYLGLERVLHPFLHPGQRPYRQAWLELMMMQPQLLASSH